MAKLKTEAKLYTYNYNLESCKSCSSQINSDFLIL